MTTSRKNYLGLTLAVLFTLVLAACGDATATSGPAATTGTTAAATTTRPVTASTTSAATTAAGTTTSAATTAAGTTTSAATSAATGATTSAATTAAGTTAATGATTRAATTSASGTATTAATSATGATTAATGATTSATSATFPTVSGATETPPDPTVAAEFNKQLTAAGLNNLTPKFYISDSEPTKLVSDANTAISGAGYKFSIPGFTQPATLPNSGGATIGLYSKSGAPDLLLLIAPAPTDASQIGKTFLLPNLNLSTTDAQKVIDQFKGHKSAMILASGTNLLPAVVALATNFASGLPAAGGGSAPTTPGATPTR